MVRVDSRNIQMDMPVAYYAAAAVAAAGAAAAAAAAAAGAYVASRLHARYSLRRAAGSSASLQKLMN